MKGTESKLSDNQIQELRILQFLIVAAFVLCLISIAYANTVPWKGTEPAGWSWDLTDMQKMLKDIYYNIVLKVALCAGTISFVFGGYKMMLGDEKEAGQGKKQMQVTIMAIIAIHLLPLAVEFGYSVVQNYQWDPYNPSKR